MKDELNRYLTEVEQEQIDEIFSRGLRRRKESGEEEEHNNFLFFKCQEEQYIHCSARKEKITSEEMKNLLREICTKCCEYGCCHFVVDERDEDLPFPKESEDEREEKEKAEIRKVFNSGKMAMLFSLVHSGRLTMDDARCISGYDQEELDEMYEGWKIAQEM